jgi:prevent-host-death family protein
VKTSVAGAFEAKNHFSEILEKAARGEETIVTKHGRPVAIIVPYREDERSAEEVLGSIARTRSKIARRGSLRETGETWKKMAREGLRE